MITTRTLFSGRHWMGIRSWLYLILAYSTIFAFFALLAWKDEKGSFFDITTVFVGIPVGLTTIVVLLSLIWSFFAKMSFSGGLAWSARFLPILWIVPLFDLIRTFGKGLIIGGPRLSGMDFLVAIGTGGLLPMDSGYTIGIRFGICILCISSGFVCWFVTRNAFKSIASMLITSIVSVALTSITSVLSLIQAFAWSAIPQEITRRSMIVLNKGYWWANLYERFPTAIDAQSDIATRLVGTAWAVLILGILLAIALFLREKGFSLFKKTVSSWEALHVLIIVAIGYGFAWEEGIGAFAGASGWLAIGLFLLLLFALRIHAIFSGNGSAQGQLMLQNVLSTTRSGGLSNEQTADIALGSLFYGALAAWILGWPVFVCFIVYIAANTLQKNRQIVLFKPVLSISRALSYAGLAGGVFFFLSQSSKITDVFFAAVLTAFLYQIIIEWVWLPKIRKTKNI